MDPDVKPVAIHKAAIIPIHLKAKVKADLDRDVWLGILEKVNINSPVKVVKSQVGDYEKGWKPV